MNQNVAKTLADRLAEKREHGLVDVKFYVHNAEQATPQKVCDEASNLFAAIEDGSAVEAFSFNDRHAAPMVAPGA